MRRSVTLLGRGMRDEWRIYVLAVGSSALFGAATVAVSRAVGWATDDIVIPAISGDADARGRIWSAGLILVAIAVTVALGVAGRRIFAGMGYAKLQANHREAITRSFLRAPMSWHRAHPAGQLLSNANSDVEAATGVFNPLPFALGVVVMIAVATVMLVRIDVWLAVAALTIIPAAVIANAVFQRYMNPAITRAQQMRAQVADIAHESFEAALVVKSLGSEDREEARFARKTDDLRAANVRVGMVRAYFDPAVELLPSAGTLLVLLVGAWRAAAGAVDAGDIVTAAYLLTLMAVPVRAFGWVLGELPRALVGYERVARVVETAGELPPGTQQLPVVAQGMRIKVRGVGLDVPLVRQSVLDDDAGAADKPGTANDRPGTAGHLVTLLNNVTLDIAPGTTVAVVGSTGSGKSTLVGLLARLQDPTRGHIALDGVDARRIANLPDHLAFVAQSTFIFEDTVRANVLLDYPADDDAVWEALRLAKVDDVVGQLPGALDAGLGERGANLSGGQRQRLAIARALVRKPRLLILDDATSAVDPRVERQILTGFTAHGTGPTVVLVAYRMASVALADEVVHIEGGRIVDVGTHDALLARDAGYRGLATAYARESARTQGDEDTTGAEATLERQRRRSAETVAELSDDLLRHAEEGVFEE